MIKLPESKKKERMRKQNKPQQENKKFFQTRAAMGNNIQK